MILREFDAKQNSVTIFAKKTGKKQVKDVGNIQEKKSCFKKLIFSPKCNHGLLVQTGVF